MKQITLNVPESQFSFFMKLIRSLNFVQVADKEENEEIYKPEFVAKIQQSKKEFEEGNSIRVKKEDLQNFLGL